MTSPGDSLGGTAVDTTGTAIARSAPGGRGARVALTDSHPRRLAVVAHPRSALIVGALLLLLTAAGAYAAGAAQRPPQATRSVLAQAVDPPGARGRTLGLARVTIPAHTRLGLHRHPGVQLAYVQKGTLTYTVKRGVVNVYRGAADQDPRVMRRGAGARPAVSAPGNG